MGERAHGTRTKYVQEKCRCDLCKKANRDYAAERSKLLKELAADIRQKTDVVLVVRKAVGEKGLKQGETVLKDVTMKRPCPGYNGEPCSKRSYLKSNSTGDLCSYCREQLLSAHTLVPVEKALKALKKMRDQESGLRTLALLSGLSRKTLYKIIKGEQKRISRDTETAILGLVIEKNQLCNDCGLSHAKEDRKRLVFRMLPARSMEISEAYPCVYPTRDKRGSREWSRTLIRDLHEMGAKLIDGTWYILKESNDADPLHREAEDDVDDREGGEDREGGDGGGALRVASLRARRLGGAQVHADQGR